MHDHGRPNKSDAQIAAANARFPGDAALAVKFARIPKLKAEWTLVIWKMTLPLTGKATSALWGLPLN
jgi:hypothetical protein